MEANLTDQPVSIQYESLWDLLRSRYLGSSHFVKSINLEAYYLGMLNTGCGFKVRFGDYTIVFNNNCCFKY